MTSSGDLDSSDAGSEPRPRVARPVAVGQPPVWTSTQLLGDGREAIILHEGQTYRLRLTRHGKLILNK